MVDLEPLEVPASDEAGITTLLVLAPHRTQRLLQRTLFLELEANLPSVAVVDALVGDPEVEVAAQSTVREGLRNRAWRRSRRDLVDGTLAAGGEFPGWIDGAEWDEQAERVTLDRVDDWACDGNGPVSSTVVLRGVTEGRAYAWRILRSGPFGRQLQLPELPDTEERWPRSLQDRSVHVFEASQVDQAYVDLLDAMNPIGEAYEPNLPLGGEACRRSTLSRTGS